MEFLPNEVQNTIKNFTIFKPKTKDELQEVVDLWCDNKVEALTKYGDISLWDTSLITDMSQLFQGRYYFNDDISKWDVSNVTDMFNMFFSCINFNQPLNIWNVSKVKNMDKLFR